MSTAQGIPQTGVTTPGMGSAMNNAMGGGVSVPGQQAGGNMIGNLASLMSNNPKLASMLQNTFGNMQKTGQGMPQQAPGGWTDHLSQWQPQSLNQAWGSMQPPAQFAAEQAQKQAALRAMQQQKMQEAQAAQSTLMAQKASTPNPQLDPKLNMQWSDYYGG